MNSQIAEEPECDDEEPETEYCDCQSAPSEDEMRTLLMKNAEMEAALRRIKSECLYDAERDDLRGWIVDCVKATLDDD